MKNALFITPLILWLSLPAHAMEHNTVDEENDFVVIEKPLTTRCAELQSVLTKHIERIEKQRKKDIATCFEKTEIDRKKQLYLNTAQYQLAVYQKCYAWYVEELAGMISKVQRLEASRSDEPDTKDLKISFVESHYTALYKHYTNISPTQRKIRELLLSENPISFDAFKTLIEELNSENKKLEAEIKILKE
jgi:hypothetical protein